MVNAILIVLAGATLIVATLTCLATITKLFKRKVPIDCGFLLDERIVKKLNLSTGDEAKPIFLRFRNSSKLTLTGVVLDMRFQRPLALSSTKTALAFIIGKTKHGRVSESGNAYYHILLSELDIFGKGDFDYRVELNTKGKRPGKYTILVTAHSTPHDYKYKKFKLYIKMS